jgi:oxygen-independent coproporphyrinogen-3 oxidase
MFGIYIHWPFCISKCPYCDFNSHVHQSIDEDLWKTSLLKDLHNIHKFSKDRTVTSIFFGGGTPSLMSAATVESLINEIQKLWDLDPKIEITLEANPNSIESQKFSQFSKAGINRVSIGIQSLRQKDLEFLGRKHSVKEAYKAIDIAGKNFKRFSFDLIYTRPEQTLEEWEEELKEALSFGTQHLSLYQLTIEQGTPFNLAYHRGDFTMPNNDKSADFYEKTNIIMQDNGLPAYEISNYAKPGEECKHNLTYWNYDDYLGIGPGAHSRITIKNNKYALRRHRSPELWLQHIRENDKILENLQLIDFSLKIEEFFMMGFRLTNGILLERIDKEFNTPLEDIFTKKKIDSLVKENLVILDEKYIKLTPAGLIRLNKILQFLFY